MDTSQQRGDRLGEREMAVAKNDAEAEHDRCQHPVEIDDVKRTMKRRQAINIGIVGTIATVLAMIVAVAVYAATVNTNVAHLQAESARARMASEKEADDRRSEDQAIRRELNEAQRANTKTHQKLTETTTRIETLLDVIAADSKRRRR